MAASRKSLYLSFRFLVEVEGLILGGFSEVTGLQAKTEVEYVEAGGVNECVRKLPMKTKYSNITLKRGITDSSAFWNWYKDTVSGKIERKSGYIILLDDEGKEKWRWKFVEAYPVKWTGAEMRADGITVAVETLELAHEGIKKA